MNQLERKAYDDLLVNRIQQRLDNCPRLDTMPGKCCDGCKVMLSCRRYYDDHIAEAIPNKLDKREYDKAIAVLSKIQGVKLDEKNA